MILVTGAAGYIGSHLIYELQKKYKVLGIDNFSNSSKKCIKTLKKSDLKKNFQFYKIDCKQYRLLEKLFKKKKIKIIIHCASLKMFCSMLTSSTRSAAPTMPSPSRPSCNI